MKFKVGDRVVALGQKSYKGTVTGTRWIPNVETVSVQFDAGAKRTLYAVELDFEEKIE